MEIFLVGLLAVQIAIWIKLGRSGGSKLGFLGLWALIVVMGVLQQHRVDAFRDGQFNIIKTHDYFHYFISAKYFNELGYNRLYICGIAAFQEIENSRIDVSPPKIDIVRDLANPKDFIRYSEIDTESGCKKNFGEFRWREFTDDIAVFLREDSSANTWQHIFADMGNNPPPPWYTVTHLFADVVPFNVNTLRLISNIDFVILIFVIPLIIYASFGPLAAAGFLILLFGNALSHTSWLVGSYGRSLWLLALTLGYCLFARGKFIFASLLFALSCSLRIFPVVFVFSLILFLFMDKNSRKLSYLMGGGVFVWGMTILLASYFTWGIESWVAFSDLLGVRVNMPAPPSISLRRAFSFLFTGELDTIYTVPDLQNWLQKMALLYQQNVHWIWFFSLCLSIGFIYGLKQIRQPLAASVMLGFFLMFCFMKPLTYYYMYLALMLPLYSFTNNYKREIGPFLVLMLLLATWSFPVLRDFGMHFTTYQTTAHTSLTILLFFCFYILVLGNKKNRNIK